MPSGAATAPWMPCISAQALMPQTPIILDDALIRFDDRRLEKAVELLKELGKERQILLFSCQGREERTAR